MSDEFMREFKRDWIRVCPYDEAKRRALWVRVTKTAVELCAGREGDDAYVRLPFNGRATHEDMLRLVDVAAYAESNYPPKKPKRRARR